jgi:hypothetical protein
MVAFHWEPRKPGRPNHPIQPSAKETTGRQMPLKPKRSHAPALLLLLGIGCSSQREVRLPDEVPRVLHEKDCPGGAQFDHYMNEEIDRYQCLDKDGKKHGPYLSITKDGREYAQYYRGILRTFPWFLDMDGQLDEERTAAFLEQKLSPVVLQEFMEHSALYQYKKPVRARLVSMDYGSADALFSQTRKAADCSEPPEGMICIEGGGLVAEVFNLETVQPHYRIYWTETFYVDEAPARKEVYPECTVESCAPATRLSWREAANHCAGKRKRLMTEKEWWLMQKRVEEDGLLVHADTEWEWSRDVFLPSPEPFQAISPISTSRLQSDGKLERLALSWTQMREEGSKLEKIATAFRCMTTTLEADQILSKAKEGFPALLDREPILPAPDPSMPLPSSWGAHDASYRKRSENTELAKTLPEDIELDYLDIYQLSARLWTYHQKYPELTALYKLGNSHFGYPILALRITDRPTEDETEPAVLVTGGKHGDEMLSTLYALDNIDYLLKRSGEPDTKAWISEMDLWFIPMVNPDGNWTALRVDASKDIGRKNGRNTDNLHRHASEGVDLDRNYPYCWGCLGETGSSTNPSSMQYRGTSPGSEPETRAVMHLAEKYRFVFSLAWHTKGRQISTSYTIPGKKAPQPNIAWQVAQELALFAPKFHDQPQLPLAGKKQLVDGTEQDWLLHSFGTHAYTIRAAEKNHSRLNDKKESILGARPYFIEMLRRIYTGPAVYGLVHDDRGPIQATVELVGQKRFEGENWTTREWDGRYHWLLAESGTYGIKVSAEGYQSKTETVSVQNNPVLMNIMLKRTGN